MPFIKERLSGDPVPDVSDAVRDQQGILRDPHTGVAVRDPAKVKPEGKPEGLERRYARLTRGCWLPSEGREKQADLEAFVASGGKEPPSRFVDQFGEPRDRMTGQRLRTMRAEVSRGLDELSGGTQSEHVNWFERERRKRLQRGRDDTQSRRALERRAGLEHKYRYDPLADAFAGDYDPI